jgi:hypothetical protein
MPRWASNTKRLGALRRALASRETTIKRLMPATRRDPYLASLVFFAAVFVTAWGMM